MTILIIEDEYHAQKRLQKIIGDLRPAALILGVLDSVEGAVEWLKNRTAPDLLFMDIQLSDGLSFEIFTQVDVQIPVIFTTAFDEYAMKAFKVNSVDYLMKPIEEDELEQAFVKWESRNNDRPDFDYQSIQTLLKSLTTTNYQKRFLLKSGQQISYVKVEDIAYFYSENSLTFLMTRQGKKHLLDRTIDELSDLLDPDSFFRINRKAIVRIEAVQKIAPYFNSRLSLTLVPAAPFDLIVSREKAKGFKEWLGG